MTTNLFFIANVKQLWTGGSFRILLPFFWTSCGVGVLNSAIFKLIRMLEWNTKHFPLNLQSGLTLSNFRNAGGGFELRNQIRHCKTVCIKRNFYLINYTVWEHSELQKEIETPVLLACAIENSTDIFGISGGLSTPPQGTPLVKAVLKYEYAMISSSPQQLMRCFFFPGNGRTKLRLDQTHPYNLVTKKKILRLVFKSLGSNWVRHRRNCYTLWSFQESPPLRSNISRISKHITITVDVIKLHATPTKVPSQPR